MRESVTLHILCGWQMEPRAMGDKVCVLNMGEAEEWEGGSNASAAPLHFSLHLFYI